ncbi:hypothetical protein L210DRAFT_3543880 [Boletus edulis BED1]|uniref:Uncharacterized protein n=1 Tax=Boletus edulis BED1 TaxID=1328754 RepID=A0AAD4BSD9_BOLED|nr:hypothetical protein L210DRAFT_3543880 [Boletus edulis BED1]
MIGSTCAMFLRAARRDGEWVQPCRMAVFFTAFPAQLILICSPPHFVLCQHIHTDYCCRAETFAYNASSGLTLTGGVTLAAFLDMVYVGGSK